MAANDLNSPIVLSIIALQYFLDLPPPHTHTLSSHMNVISKSSLNLMCGYRLDPVFLLRLRGPSDCLL